MSRSPGRGSRVDIFLAVMCGYAVGSVPFAYCLGRLRGVDLLAAGTRNPGAANLFRQVSPSLGVVAALADFGKGALAVRASQWLGVSDGLSLVGGAAAVVGHWHSPLLRFRGGEGLAPAVGAGLGALPVAAAIGTTCGVVMIAVLHNTGWGSAVGWCVFVGVAYALGDPALVIWGTVGLAAGVTVRATLRQKMARRAPRRIVRDGDDVKEPSEPREDS
jgi:glycerol-3-phosphate acyltransferase PlsY